MTLYKNNQYFSVIQRSLQRAKHDNSCPEVNPKDMHFDIPEEFATLILHDTGSQDKNRIITLGHPDFMPILKKDLLFGDGTFQVVPSVFYQLYTVHAKIGGNYPPSIYFLLPNKTARTYGRMVQIMKEVAPGCDPKRCGNIKLV